VGWLQVSSKTVDEVGINNANFFRSAVTRPTAFDQIVRGTFHFDLSLHGKRLGCKPSPREGLPERWNCSSLRPWASPN
jgi:hypothetical protein